MPPSQSRTQIPLPRPRPQREGERQPNVYFDPEIKPSLSNMQRAGGGGNSMVRDWIAQKHEGPYDRQFGQSNLGEDYTVEKGQLTFDAEGTEGGRFHSRTAHLPPDPSGVTIGRGYDVGQHSASKTLADLVAAGIPEEQAAIFAEAARKQGKTAKEWLDANKDRLPEITSGQQKALFDSTYGEMADDVQRISNKPDTRAAYGEMDLDEVDPTVRDTLVDLRYRGDYTTNSRTRVQGLAADNDVAGLAELMNDRDKWANVPPDRFNRRAAFATQGAQEVQAQKDLFWTFAAPFEQVGNPDYDLYGRKAPESGESEESETSE